MTNEDPEAWREECLKKQAAGVRYELNCADGTWLAGEWKFSEYKEEYREVKGDPKMLTVESIVALEHLARTCSADKGTASLSPTIHHIAERKLWLAQREAGTNEVWQYKLMGIGDSVDIDVGREPKWCPENKYHPKPKTVTYYFAFALNVFREPVFLYNKSKEDLIRKSKEIDWNIIGDIEEREVAQ